MALLTSRGFGRAANEGFGTGFAGALQLLLQQKSEALQRELEGQRAKQQKEQFDQQMATTREQFDREMLFKENRAQKADVVSEIERLTMQKNRSEDLSDRNARALEERSDREARQRIAEEQLDLQRKELGIKEGESAARIRESDRRNEPIGPEMAQVMNAQIGAPVFRGGESQDYVDTIMKARATGANIRESEIRGQNENERTKIEQKKVDIVEKKDRQDTVERVFAAFQGQYKDLSTTYERYAGQSVDAQVDTLKGMIANSLDDKEKKQLLGVMSNLTSAKSVEERAAAADAYAATVMGDRIKNNPAFKALLGGLEEEVRNKLVSEFGKSAEPKTETLKPQTQNDLTPEQQRKLAVSKSSDRDALAAYFSSQNKQMEDSKKIRVFFGDDEFEMPLPAKSDGMSERDYQSNVAQIRQKMETPEGRIEAIDAWEAFREGTQLGTIRQMLSGSAAQKKMVVEALYGSIVNRRQNPQVYKMMK